MNNMWYQWDMEHTFASR